MSTIEISSAPRAYSAKENQPAATPTLRRYGLLRQILHMPFAGAWIALRFLLVPVLFVPYKLGSSMRWAYRLDFLLKRSLFPLTEAADETPWLAIKPQLRVGDAIPELQIRKGERFIDLAALTKNGRLLLVLYRGSWCPYSRLHLADLATARRRLEELGVTMLAVSVHNDEKWWRSKGVELAMSADPGGALYRVLGVGIAPPISQRVWGMLLPHESVFLFERGGRLLACDTRKLSSLKMRQTFLSAEAWLRIAAGTPRAE